MSVPLSIWMLVVWFWRNFCNGPNHVKQQMVKKKKKKRIINNSDCELNSLLRLQSSIISYFPALEVNSCLSAIEPWGESEVVVSCNRVKSGMWVCVHMCFYSEKGVFSTQLYISHPHLKQISQWEVFLPAGTNRHLTDVGGGGGFISSLCHDMTAELKANTQKSSICISCWVSQKSLSEM